MRLIEQENLGLGAGWNRGIETTEGRYVLILNADAWLTEGSLDELVAFADAASRRGRRRAAAAQPDGTLQRSVRGFPTVWRLATEYFFLRKLAPRSRALNAFYAGGFAHDEVREAEFVMGACMLVRRAAIAEVGVLDESFFLFSEETDWCYRFEQAGWKVLFFPGPSASTSAARRTAGGCSGRTCAGIFAFSRSIRPRPTQSGPAGCCAAPAACGPPLQRVSGRSTVTRPAGSARVTCPRCSSDAVSSILLWVRLGLATGVVLLARVRGRAGGRRAGRVGGALVVAGVRVRRARRHVRRGNGADARARSCCWPPGWRRCRSSAVVAAGGRRAGARWPWPVCCSAFCSGTSPAISVATASSTSRACASSSRSATSLCTGSTSSPTEVSIPATRSRSGTGFSRSSPRSRGRPGACRAARVEHPGAARRARVVRGRLGALPVPCRRRCATAAASVALGAMASGHGGSFASLALPATVSQRLLAPAAIALAVETVRAPSRGRVATTAAAGLALAVVHPTYALFVLIPFAGFLVVRWGWTREDCARASPRARPWRCRRVRSRSG